MVPRLLTEVFQVTRRMRLIRRQIHLLLQRRQLPLLKLCPIIQRLNTVTNDTAILRMTAISEALEVGLTRSMPVLAAVAVTVTATLSLSIGFLLEEDTEIFMVVIIMGMQVATEVTLTADAAICIHPMTMTGDTEIAQDVGGRLLLWIDMDTHTTIEPLHRQRVWHHRMGGQARNIMEVEVGA